MVIQLHLKYVNFTFNARKFIPKLLVIYCTLKKKLNSSCLVIQFQSQYIVRLLTVVSLISLVIYHAEPCKIFSYTIASVFKNTEYWLNLFTVHHSGGVFFSSSYFSSVLIVFLVCLKRIAIRD